VKFNKISALKRNSMGMDKRKKPMDALLGHCWRDT